MNDILDTPIQSSNQPYPIFSMFAFCIAVLEMGFIVYLMTSLPTTIKPSEDISFAKSLVMPFRILVVLGTVISTISIFRKEDSIYYKWIAAWMNFVLITIFISFFIHANFFNK